MVVWAVRVGMVVVFEASSYLGIAWTGSVITPGCHTSTPVWMWGNWRAYCTGLRGR